MIYRRAFIEKLCMQRKQGGENIAGFGGVQNFWAAKKIRISWF